MQSLSPGRFVPVLLLIAAAQAPAASAAAPEGRGPTLGAVLQSKQVARNIFKTSCRRVRVVVRRQTPNPRYVGQAMPPCRIVIRRGDYSFVRICALIVHEYGHLAGREHSRNRNDIMHPARPPRYAPCVRHAGLVQRRVRAAREDGPDSWVETAGHRRR